MASFSSRAKIVEGPIDFGKRELEVLVPTIRYTGRQSVLVQFNWNYCQICLAGQILTNSKPFKSPGFRDRMPQF
jgi:hypothetical protein